MKKTACKPGRPTKEETTTLSIRIPVTLKKELMDAYKGSLNKKLIDYMNGLKTDSLSLDS